MTRFFLAAFFLTPALAFAQVEKAGDVRAAPAPAAAIGAAVTAPALAAPAPAAAAQAAAVPARSAVLPARVGPARTEPASADRKPSAAAVLSLSARLSAPTESDSGRAVFDGGAPRSAESLTLGAAAADGPRLKRAAERAQAPAPAVALKKHVVETAELGASAVALHFLTGMAFLAVGAHAAFPALAGALWLLGGGALIQQLGQLRSVRVGGWQASHDQKMRHDYGTGKLKDIRGRKYGEDRYDEYAPGPVSRRERLITDAAAFAMGLPWVAFAGPKAVALYAAGAAAAFAARLLWRARFPERPAAVAPDNFNYDR
jgi:hypothetical protein